MNIYNKNWAQYEYSYNLANSRENWAPQKNSTRACAHVEFTGGRVKIMWKAKVKDQLLACALP